MKEKPRINYVTHLPDLMTPAHYNAAHQQKVIRFQLKLGDEGLEIIGDSPYPGLLEELLESLEPEAVEMMLCG